MASTPCSPFPCRRILAIIRIDGVNISRARRGHLHLVREIRGQSGRQQTHGQETADAVEPRGAHLLQQIRTRASSTTPSPMTTDAGTPASPTPTGRTKPRYLPAICPALRPSRDPDPSPPTWLCTRPVARWAVSWPPLGRTVATVGRFSWPPLDRNPWPLTRLFSNRPASRCDSSCPRRDFCPLWGYPTMRTLRIGGSCLALVGCLACRAALPT